MFFPQVERLPEIMLYVDPFPERVLATDLLLELDPELFEVDLTLFLPIIISTITF